MKALGPPFDKAQLVDDYDMLLRRVLGWLDGVLLAYVRPVLDKTFGKLPRKTRIERRLPTLLIFLRDLGEGRLPASLRLADGLPAPPDVAREFHARLHGNAVAAQFQDILDELEFARVLSESEARIPARALSETILSRLAAAAAEGLKPVWVEAKPAVARKRPFDLDVFMRAWRPGLMSAVAHALAGTKAERGGALRRGTGMNWLGAINAKKSELRPTPRRYVTSADRVPPHGGAIARARSSKRLAAKWRPAWGS